jgi:hypothetical protein
MRVRTLHRYHNFVILDLYATITLLTMQSEKKLNYLNENKLVIVNKTSFPLTIVRKELQEQNRIRKYKKDVLFWLKIQHKAP